MPRVDSGYAPRPEGLQVTASPNILTEQAQNDPRGSTAFRLAEALGAAAPAMEQIGARFNDAEREKAKAYANSMTVDELNSKVRSGEMLPSQSPLFAATVHHIYGENTMAKIERDTLSKLQTGQLRFDSPESLDKYLTDARNGALEGQSKYAVAGFDKGWDQFKNSISTANTRIMNEQFVQRGTQESDDNLHSVLTMVTAPGYDGTKEDAAKYLADRFQLLRKTSLLRDDQAKDSLSGLLSSVAQSGDTKLLEALLNQGLDSGSSVRSTIGSLKAESFVQHTLIQDDKNQRQRVDTEIRPFLEWADKGELEGKNRQEFDNWIKQNERWVTTSTIHHITNANLHAQARMQKELEQAKMLAMAEASQANAQQVTQVALASGNYAFLPQQKVITANGEQADFQQKKYAEETLSQMGAKLPLDKQVQLWETNGLTNPAWEKIVQAGVSNVASVGWGYDGKNVGTLNPQGQAAIQQYLQIAAVSPAAADKLAGKDAPLLSDIKFLVERGGFPDISQAATMVNQVRNASIEKTDYDSIKQKVKSSVDNVVNPHFWSSPVGWVKGLFGNDKVNLLSVQHDIRRRSELLIQTGQFKDPDSAVKATVEYLANPAVTTKINNTIYYNKDLPTVPKNENPGQWFDRFITEVPGKLAADRKMSPRDVRLAPNTTGGYTAFIADVPLTDEYGTMQHYTKEQVTQWIGKAYDEDRVKATDDRNYSLWKDRLNREMIAKLPKDSLPGTGQSKRIITMDTVGSRQAYDDFVKRGIANKPVDDLIKEYKPKGK